MEGWRGGGEENKKTDRVKVYFTPKKGHQREYV